MKFLKQKTFINVGLPKLKISRLNPNQKISLVKKGNLTG